MSTEALMFCATGGLRSVECATFSPQAEIIIRTSFAVGQKQKRHLFCLRPRQNQCPRCLTTSYASERAFQVVFGGYNHALIVFFRCCAQYAFRCPNLCSYYFHGNFQESTRYYFLFQKT